ncbi:CSC1-like protein At1g32090 [Pyrus x bretschneideri]|uniref:CSC1-like protein At1g32090 n=1 Tax=Pyrus x bretschneideri TaxID=225117 RepID=UPI00202E49A1|nr:CSC1-like protein At1g32090 [Pyrus x bretschneideri]XP_048434529.1 CSC1-like protein At1g32090 [Pyrus x bretschneideri]XP_048434530.1 CSC1-like protein At1g32090 [Pyrus x bretschneideri]XP_048434531.1 CSC1-like protein At1g32090 [Pyrus x bretschneideri]XP_048434532.1 CSC1-like protein At1g32090 [Pyrus x bretschneideri]
MATLGDIGVSAFINILSAFAFLLAFALLRIQPVNDRVYFPKWYISGGRSSPRRSANFVGKFVNLNVKTYLTFLNWMPQAMRMSESEIISHAGLDSAVFLRIYILGLKIFVPMAVLALLILIPVNVSSGTLYFLKKELVLSDIDKLSISNVRPKSIRFFVHIGLEYLFTFWTCYMLYKEYDYVASMRLQFLTSQHRRAEQFTVVVRNIPHVSGRSVSDSVDHFFKTNHPDHYLCHQAVYNANKFAKLVRKRDRLQNWLDYNLLKFERHPDKKPTMKNGFLGLWGTKVDSIEYYKKQIQEFEKSMALERQKILKDTKSILPVAFVSFDSRWAAAVCAQTQQSRNPTLWLTNWAPEPRDVYWRNLAIPFVSLSIRKLVISLSVFALVFFYMIPIAFVQSLANLEGLERVAPFLRPVVELKFIKSFLQGFLPGLALKIFLYILPAVLMIMSKIEGHIALSTLERKTSVKYYYFMLVNVFLGSIVTGTAFQQLHSFIHQSPTEIPRTIGVSIPTKATFFITYIMVDGWAGIAGEILRLKRLVIFHLKNMFLVKTERDRIKATDPGSVDFPETLPSLQLYFLLGIVYAVITPILLPFILVFFAFAYLVYRHQIINVYNQRYESAAAFWPQVHSRIVASLLISQLLLMGLLSTKKAANSTPLLVVLPILTLSFHKFCKYRFEPAFRKYPLEEAMAKDTMERTAEPDLNMKSYLADAYLHPIFRSFEEEPPVEEEQELVEVRVDKQQTRIATPITSELSSPSPPPYVHHTESPPQYSYYQSSPPQYVYNSNSPPRYVYHSTSPPHYAYLNEDH